MSDTDFSGKRVLVVGGSSGIGNGIARAFLDRGAKVAVWGTRASATDYSASEGSDLSGLDYAQVDVGSPEAIFAARAPFDVLDVLVLLTGFPLQSKYLRHVRHHHRPIWEEMNRRASRRWRYFKGMPSTGLLISTYIGDRDYRRMKRAAISG